MRLPLILVGFAAVAWATQLSAAPLVYEPFDSTSATDESSLSGFQGDSSIGLGSSTWTVHSREGNSSTWEQDGLSFAADFPTRGGSTDLTGDNPDGGGDGSKDGTGAWVDPDAAMGSTRFISSLVRFTSDADYHSNRSPAFDDAGDSVAPGNTTISYVSDRYSSELGEVRINYGSSQQNATGGNALVDHQVFLTVGYLAGVGNADGTDDTAKVWIFSQDQWNTLNNDQASYDTVAELDALTQGTAADEVWTKLSITSTNSDTLSLDDVDFTGFQSWRADTRMDELRVDGELTEVLYPTAIPEPASFVLLAPAGLALLRRRR